MQTIRHVISQALCIGRLKQDYIFGGLKSTTWKHPPLSVNLQKRVPHFENPLHGIN